MLALLAAPVVVLPMAWGRLRDRRVVEDVELEVARACVQINQ